MGIKNKAEYMAHWSVLHHLLGLINRSGLGELIVLRGSLLMKAWYGESAREPADVDWVCLETEYGNPPAHFRGTIDDVLALRYEILRRRRCHYHGPKDRRRSDQR
jgi:hypothetical protein